MGTFADSLFTVLMGWVKGLVNALWALFSSDRTTALEFLGKNWLMIAVVIVGAGLVIDWIIWLLRWQPYHLWAQRARRLLRMEEPVQEEETDTRAHAAVMPYKKSAYREDRMDESMEIEQYAPPVQMEDEQEVFQQASEAPDEYAYPGMRYDSTATQELSGTQRYGAVTQEGPGAAEVARRKAEIEAWQLHMQEEVRARAEAERAQREAEQARLAREAQEAEQARLAEYEAEQARLAQQEYERQLAEYERQKAQYELELAEYERKKAEYETELARQQAMQEQADELAPQTRRRRTAQKSYSDYVTGEAVETLPDAPHWPQMNENSYHAAPKKEADKPKKHNKLLDQMAKMIDTEEAEIAVRTKLPPRVDMHDAYKPAAAPRKPGRRTRNT